MSEVNQDVNKDVKTGAGDDLEFLDTVAAAEEGAVMELRSPISGEVLRHLSEEKDGEGNPLPGRPFTIRYRGKDSEAIVALSRAQTDRRIQANMRTRQPILAATIQRDNIELLVAATISWDIRDGGKPVKSTPAEYRRLYTKHRWMFEQGDEFTDLRANFPTTGGSSS